MVLRGTPQQFCRTMAQFDTISRLVLMYPESRSHAARVSPALVVAGDNSDCTLQRKTHSSRKEATYLWQDHVRCDSISAILSANRVARDGALIQAHTKKSDLKRERDGHVDHAA